MHHDNGLQDYIDEFELSHYFKYSIILNLFTRIKRLLNFFLSTKLNKQNNTVKKNVSIYLVFFFFIFT